MRPDSMILDLRRGWKGFLIFTIVVMLLAGMFPFFFPIVQEDFAGGNDLEKAEFVELSAIDGEIMLTWEFEDHEDVLEYRIIEDRSSHMATAKVVASSTDRNVTIPHADGEERYFGVIAVMNDSTKMPVGMASTAELIDPIEELMSTPYLRIFTAGREDLRMDDIAGFMSVEFYSWLFLLVGTWLAYISARSLGSDYDKRRMDIIFSSPIPRRRYLLEKFSLLSLVTLAVLMVSAAFMAFSIALIGEGGELGLQQIALSLLGAWPLFMAVISLALLFAVLLRSSRGATALTFGVILIQYVLNVLGHMVEGLSWVHSLTILTYWDYNSVLLDDVFVIGDALLLLGVAAIVLIVALYVFERVDMPS